MGENFKLRWNDHHSIFFSTAEALCQGDHLTDVTLSCGKREFSAHKLVLSICSTYFNELFTPKPENKNRPANGAAIVYLKDVDAHHMELLLNFMYRGEINVEEDELMDLIATARGLSIRGLSDSDEDTNSNENSSRQIPLPPPPSNNVPKNQPPKAVKRSKSPSQPSTSSAGASPVVDASAAKKIKHESPVVELAPEGYDDDSGGGDGESGAEEFANPDAVYAEGQEEYDIEEGEGDGMMFEGDLPHPEKQYAQDIVTEEAVSQWLLPRIQPEVARILPRIQPEVQPSSSQWLLPRIQPEVQPCSSREDLQYSSESEAEIQIINYIDHRVSENMSNSNVCDHCSKIFETEQNLIEHKNAVSASLLSFLRPEVVQPSNSEAEAEIQIVNYVDNAQNMSSNNCDHCSRVFETEENLLEHKKAVSASLRAAFF